MNALVINNNITINNLNNNNNLNTVSDFYNSIVFLYIRKNICLLINKKINLIKKI